MTKTTLIRTLTALLTLAYTFALVMSAAHLTQWYGLYNGSPDPHIAPGLAVALELVAFLLSITSNALKGQISLWAFWGPTGRCSRSGSATPTPCTARPRARRYG